eukprot:6337876-Prymnesium_polylepis.1
MPSGLAGRAAAVPPPPPVDGAAAVGHIGAPRFRTALVTAAPARHLTAGTRLPRQGGRAGRARCRAVHWRACSRAASDADGRALARRAPSQPVVRATARRGERRQSPAPSSSQCELAARGGPTPRLSPLVRGRQCRRHARAPMARGGAVCRWPTRRTALSAAGHQACTDLALTACVAKSKASIKAQYTFIIG